MPTSVRLDPKTERLIERLARKKKQTKSEVIREAIEVLASQETRLDVQGGPYDAVADLIGCVSGGPPDLSERTGKRFLRLLTEKKRLKKW